MYYKKNRILVIKVSIYNFFITNYFQDNKILKETKQ